MEPLAYRFFEAFFNKLNSFIAAVFPTLMESFGIWARSFISLYCLIVGIMIMKGMTGSRTKDFVVSLVVLPAIWALVFESDVYLDLIAMPLVEFTIDISNFFINVLNQQSEISDLFQSMDEMIDRIFKITSGIEPAGFWKKTWYKFKLGLLTLILLAVFIAVYVIFLALMIIGLFSMYVLFTVGGICIFFVSFKETRFIFYSWLRALVNYMLLIIFASIIMSICLFGLDDSIDKLAALKTKNLLLSSQYLWAVCWACLTAAMLLRAPDYASALSGGMASRTSGISGGVGMARRGAVSMGKMAYSKMMMPK